MISTLRRPNNADRGMETLWRLLTSGGGSINIGERRPHSWLEGPYKRMLVSQLPEDKDEDRFKLGSEGMVGSPEMGRQNIVCVRGMHRSGTSLLTRILNLIGVYLGPEHDLSQPNVGNPRGHWAVGDHAP